MEGILINMVKTKGTLAQDSPYNFVTDYYEFLYLNDLEDDNTSIVIFLFYYIYHRSLSLLANPAIQFGPIEAYFYSQTADILLASAANRVTFANSAPLEPGIAYARGVAIDVKRTNYRNAFGDKVLFDADNRLLKINSSINNCAQWFYDLVLVHQLKSLNQKNLKSFWASQNNMVLDNQLILSCLNYFRSTIPKLAGSAAGIASLSDSDFNKYHSNYSASASLVMLFYNGLPAELQFIVSQNTLDLVNVSLANPTNVDANNAIPKKTLAVAYVFLSVFKINFGDWWQGKKAIEQQGAMFFTQTSMYFIRLKKILQNDSNISRAYTLRELAAASPSSVTDVVIDAQTIANAEASRTERLNKAVEKATRRNKLDNRRDNTIPIVTYVAADFDVDVIDKFDDDI